MSRTALHEPSLEFPSSITSSVRSITAALYRIELESALSDSMHGTITHFELVTARLLDSDGYEGVGYSYTVGRNGRAVLASLQEAAELMTGMDTSRIAAVGPQLWWQLHYGGRGGPTVLALSAIDIALWDLKGKRLRQPLWRLLGAYDPKVPVYAGGVDLDLPLNELLRQTDRNLERGFRAIKMKVGRDDLREDVERVASMRKHLGDGFPLMLDANMKWNVERSLRASRALAPFEPAWLEEPIPPDDVAGHRTLMSQGMLPIATGENLRTLWDFKNLMDVNGVAFPEPDVTNCGGISNFMKIGHLAEAHHLPVTSHGAHDVTVHLLAALPNRSYLEAHGFGLDRYLEDPLQVADGFALAPDRPGHGIAFDWARLDAL